MKSKRGIIVVAITAMILSATSVYGEDVNMQENSVWGSGEIFNSNEIRQNQLEEETEDLIMLECESSEGVGKFSDGENLANEGLVTNTGEFSYEYLPESDTYRIVKGIDIENVVIPYEYNGKFVSEVGEKAFYGCSHIKTVKTEFNKERSGKYIRICKSAFENCNNLRQIELRWAKLESKAFYNCPRLWAYYGAGAESPYDTEIQEDSFDPDTKMIFRNMYELPESVDRFAQKYRVFTEYVENPTEIFEENGFTSYEFQYNKYSCIDCTDTVSNVNLGNMTVIGRKAFYGCTNVRKVLISSTTKTIEAKAFARCMNMAITIPTEVTEISEDAFEGALGITIYADKGSYAEKYAKKHGLTCKTISAPIEVPIPKLKVTYNTKYGDATLSWTPVEYADQYYIYKYDTATKKYKRVAKTNQNTTSYKIESPVGKTEKYKVCVRTAASIYTSQYSKKSNTVVIQGRPESSEIISKKKKGKSITLKWTKSKGAQGYILYRYDKKTKKYVKLKTIKNGNTVTYTDKTGKLNKNDSYRVTAYCITKDGMKLYGR